MIFIRKIPRIVNKYNKPTSHNRNVKTINDIIANKKYDELLKYDKFEWRLFEEHLLLWKK